MTGGGDAASHVVQSAAQVVAGTSQRVAGTASAASTAEGSWAPRPPPPVREQRGEGGHSVPWSVFRPSRGCSTAPRLPPSPSAQLLLLCMPAPACPKHIHTLSDMLRHCQSRVGIRAQGESLSSPPPIPCYSVGSRVSPPILAAWAHPLAPGRPTARGPVPRHQRPPIPALTPRAVCLTPTIDPMRRRGAPAVSACGIPVVP